MKSNLDLIREVDLFPYEDHEPEAHQRIMSNIYTLLWEDDRGSYPIGYVLTRVHDQLLALDPAIRGPMTSDSEARTMTLFKEGGFDERTARAAAVADHFRRNDTFKILRKWRNELWPVYGRNGELLFSMERCALGLLGAVRYGVHMSAYVRDDSVPFGIKLWIARRSLTKETFPGMLDNTAAGGLMTGEDPFECIIREADEEASLPEDVVRNHAENPGTVTYIYITNEAQVGEAGFIYPECQWIYDLELPLDVIPKPKDGEAEGFYLKTVDEVKEDLRQGRFKDNCALVALNFLERRGMLQEEGEKELEEMRRRMNRVMPFPGPHQQGWRRQA
ncbi:hypothetical protein NLU13_4978 [Sarocladium strictum]|uniref:Nudix hydrolase domain-containing protein n=1 Tax=Sarocladium strictum TaxID=5046 RepID=A0AA39GJX0_SARSR|nr:hypothetical protein NLU13_4978 [Sarocladium strictum]